MAGPFQAQPAVTVVHPHRADAAVPGRGFGVGFLHLHLVGGGVGRQGVGEVAATFQYDVGLAGGRAAGVGRAQEDGAAAAAGFDGERAIGPDDAELAQPARGGEAVTKG